MTTRKRSRRAAKSKTSAIKTENDTVISETSDKDLDQLIAWLEDFDMQFDNQLALFDDLLVQKLKAVERSYSIELMTIPSEIRNSKVLRNSDCQDNSKPTVTQQVTVHAVDTNTQTHHNPRKHSRTRHNSSEVSTVHHQVTRSSSLNARSKVKLMKTATISKFKTPSCQSIFSSAPSLITPKVIPNTPLSVLRYPRHGELAISLSGSPLVVTSVPNEQIPSVNVPLTDGRVMSILPEPNLRLFDNPVLDEETRQQLKNLRQHINTLINWSQ